MRQYALATLEIAKEGERDPERLSERMICSSRNPEAADCVLPLADERATVVTSRAEHYRQLARDCFHGPERPARGPDVKDAAAEGGIAMAISFQDADKFRLKHAEELLALFEGARGQHYRQLARDCFHGPERPARGPDVKDAAAEGGITMAISFQDADKFRLKHAEELLALFEGARGRPARTTDELAQWLDSVDDDLADDIAREVADAG